MEGWGRSKRNEDGVDDLIADSIIHMLFVFRSSAILIEVPSVVYFPDRYELSEVQALVCFND